MRYSLSALTSRYSGCNDTLLGNGKMLSRENTPWYNDAELAILNKIAAELVAARRSEGEAQLAVHRAWFAGATVDALRRAVAEHRTPLPGEQREPDWQ